MNHQKSKYKEFTVPKFPAQINVAKGKTVNLSPEQINSTEFEAAIHWLSLKKDNKRVISCIKSLSNITFLMLLYQLLSTQSWMVLEPLISNGIDQSPNLQATVKAFLKSFSNYWDKWLLKSISISLKLLSYYSRNIMISTKTDPENCG